MQPQIKRTIRRPEVLAKTGLSATTIYNLEKQNQFPRHHMQSQRCAVWVEAEIDAWIDARKAKPIEAVKGPDRASRTAAASRREVLVERVKSALKPLGETLCRAGGKKVRYYSVNELGRIVRIAAPLSSIAAEVGVLKDPDPASRLASATRRVKFGVDGAVR